LETRCVESGKCFKKMDLKMTLPNGNKTVVKVPLTSPTLFQL
jgi:hypothetical protein